MQPKLLIPLALTILALSAAPALAVDGGRPDGAGHPNVGLLVFQDPQLGDLPIGICTGSVVSDHLFLTAAHCIENGIVGGDATWAVTLEPGSPTAGVVPGGVVFDAFPQCCIVGDSSSLVDAARVVVADYDPRTGSGTDLAVLDFTGHPFAGIAPVRLPRLGMLDHLAPGGARKGPQFTLVGYGAELRDGRTYVPGYRKTGRASFAGLTAHWLELTDSSTAAVPHDGALCTGDSGSPQFLGGSDIEVSLLHESDAACNGTSLSQRLDTPTARAFLAPILGGA